MENYRKRIADSILERKLATSGAVLIEGPKWCGKTTTAEQHAKSILYMDDPDSITNNLVAADINPKQLLQGDKPKLKDEWQIAPQLWDAIRFDQYRNLGIINQKVLHTIHFSLFTIHFFLSGR